MKKYSTQNLYECSFLLASGFKLLSKESIGSKTTLLFEESSALNKAVMDFYNGEGLVPAKLLFDFYRSLKDMVFQR